jgi:hypothetical protein
MRQQRPTRDRRQLTLAQPIRLPGVPLTFFAVQPTSVQLEFIEPPGAPMFTGIPAVRLEPGDLAPINATLTPQGGPDDAYLLELFFGVQIPADAVLNYPGQDPQMRFPNGDFLAAGRLRLPGPTGTTVQLTAVNGPITAQVTVWDSILAGGTLSKSDGVQDGETFDVIVPNAAGGSVTITGHFSAGNPVMPPGLVQAWTWSVLHSWWN